MKYAFLGSLVALVLQAGLATAQTMPTYSVSSLPLGDYPAAGLANYPQAGAEGIPVDPSSPMPPGSVTRLVATPAGGPFPLPYSEPAPGYHDVWGMGTGPYNTVPGHYSAHGCWFSAEYLVWWVDDGPLPRHLISNGPLGDCGCSGSILGNSELDFSAFSGLRLTAGHWFDCQDIFGIEVSGFLLEQRSASFGVLSNGTMGAPQIGLPFFNTQTGVQDFAAFATPCCLAGRLDVSGSSQLWGAEVNLVGNLCRDCKHEVSLLGGFRYADLQEHLTIGGSSTPTMGGSVFFGGQSFPEPAITSTLDSFRARNQFYGGQFGLRTEFCFGNIFVDCTGKLALGDSHETVDVGGVSTLMSGPFGPTRILPGGLFAVPSNSGSASADAFAVIPEVEVHVGYHLTHNVTVTIGYNFLYWSDVVRPGDQVNRNVNPSQVPTFAEFGKNTGCACPQLMGVRSTDFWAQGLTFGVGVTY
jgi:hypothetical protein